MVSLGTNMIDHASEMEFYTILGTLEQFDCLNRTL